MNIFLKAYTAQNLGDDLFIKIICNRYNNHKFHLLIKEEYIGYFSNIKNLIIYTYKNNTDRIIKKNEILNKSDVLVFIGGSIFIEPEDIYNKYLFELEEDIKKTKEFYIIGANFGPYKTEKYYEYVKNNILKKAKFTCFRDKYSYEIFKDLDNVSYHKDVVFGLDITESKKNKQVGISVISNFGRNIKEKEYNNYIDKIIEIINFYNNLDYKINIFSFCEKEKDSLAIDNIINKSNIKINKEIYNGNIEEFLYKFASQDIIIGTRFHSVILSMIFKSKFIPICYSNKTKEMLKDIDKKITFYDFENIQELKCDNLNKKLNEETLEELKTDAHKQFKMLDQILL
jgi:colanic acid/amylovoran biosynthesis protein